MSQRMFAPARTLAFSNPLKGDLMTRFRESRPAKQPKNALHDHSYTPAEVSRFGRTHIRDSHPLPLFSVEHARRHPRARSRMCHKKPCAIWNC